MPPVCVPDIRETGKPRERLAAAIRRLFQEMMKESRREAVGQGLTIPQMMAMRGLIEMGPTPTTFWADRLGFSPSAVSEMVEGLVKRGYAVRRHDTRDRRKVMISLSSRGATLAREMHERLNLHWQGRFQLLTAAQVDSGVEVLSILSGTEPPRLKHPKVNPKAPRPRSRGSMGTAGPRARVAGVQR